MKAIKCEMCDSTEVVKDGDYFVCQNCGTKYTLETAKNMMFSGEVVVDNTASLDNYLTLAVNAFDSKNYSLAESYCNKYLEIDDSNSKIWELKGESAVLQSNGFNKRADECVECLKKACSLVDEADKPKLKKEYGSKIIKYYTGLWEYAWKSWSIKIDQATAMNVIAEYSTIKSKIKALEGIFDFSETKIEDIYVLLAKKYVATAHQKKKSEYRAVTTDNLSDYVIKQWDNWQKSVSTCPMLLGAAGDALYNADRKSEASSIYNDAIAVASQISLQSRCRMYAGKLVQVDLTAMCSEWINRIKEVNSEYNPPELKLTEQAQAAATTAAKKDAGCMVGLVVGIFAFIYIIVLMFS